MKLSIENRNISYESIHSDNQELRISLILAVGPNHAWEISNLTGMLITSVRRALHNLEEKGKVRECGSVFHEATQRSVTLYGLWSEDETGQFRFA